MVDILQTETLRSTQEATTEDQIRKQNEHKTNLRREVRDDRWADAQFLATNELTNRTAMVLVLKGNLRDNLHASKIQRYHLLHQLQNTEESKKQLIELLQDTKAEEETEKMLNMVDNLLTSNLLNSRSPMVNLYNSVIPDE
eukprot:TRINITY_DN440_c0_g1_i1.p1 TRINITY_DN440_c0_g1~~TRINITY_DN440_c0_g1_i1.p1  ORF type:complete len:141 (-),score=17.67 TRINITY_DN440_c0_g1_i1:261-683(-)